MEKFECSCNLGQTGGGDPQLRQKSSQARGPWALAIGKHGHATTEGWVLGGRARRRDRVRAAPTVSDGAKKNQSSGRFCKGAKAGEAPGWKVRVQGYKDGRMQGSSYSMEHA